MKQPLSSTSLSSARSVRKKHMGPLYRVMFFCSLSPYRSNQNRGLSRTPDHEVSHSPADRMEQKNKLCTVGKKNLSGCVQTASYKKWVHVVEMLDESEHEAGKTSRAKNE